MPWCLKAVLQPGTLHTISMGAAEMPGIYRLEIHPIPGSGKVNVSGVAPREAVKVAFDFFKAKLLACERLDETGRACTLQHLTSLNYKTAVRHKR